MTHNEPWYGKIMACDRCALLERRIKHQRFTTLATALTAIVSGSVFLAVLFYT